MALATILDTLRTLMLAIPGMSPKVYTYEPWAAQASEVSALFRTGLHIHAWTMTRESTEETRLATGRENERRHTIVIRGYYGLAQSGESAITFQALIETVCTTLRNQPTLSGTAEITEPVQVALVEPRMFCAVLCHYAELRLIAQELIQW